MSNHQTFNIARQGDVQHRVNELKQRSEDIKSRIALTLKHLWNPERQLKVVRANTDFKGLRESFPQFSEVIDYLENVVIGMGRLGLPFEVPPILLMGDPGLGKTYFASELASLFGLPFKDLSMAIASASFSLAGSSLQWGEGTVGDLAKFMAESTVANPIILLDEVDKVNTKGAYNPVNVLYGWLEPHSARRFRDEALEIEIDVSRVIWIATGNDAESIPEPIKSRLRTFVIKQPTPRRMEQVVRNIYTSIRKSKAYGKLLSENIDDDVVAVLSRRSPRGVRMAIEVGVFNAIKEYREGLTVSDISKVEKEKRHVGFI